MRRTDPEGRPSRRGVAGLVLLALALLALGAGVLWLDRVRSGVPYQGGDRMVAGLDAEVEILRDSLGIPWIRAGSEEDLFFAQGWAHATDRFWQMDLLRRTAEGRLAEILGADAVAADRFLRTVGIGKGVEGTAEVLDPRTRTILEAYTAGVNAALDSWRGPPPPEYVLLRTEPEPWTVSHTLAVEKVMAWDLSRYQQAVLLLRAQRELDDDRLAWLLPEYPGWGVTIDGVPGLEAGPSRPRAGYRGGSGTDPLEAPELAARLLRAGSVQGASNSWVVGGERTASGRPLLANDMHLALGFPPIFHLAALQAPGLEAAGVSLPGVPGVVVGRTIGAAWGFTNAYVHDTDLVLEREDPEDPGRYLTAEGSEAFDSREEVIRVRGAPPDTLRIRTTRHGPIISPVEGAAGDDLVALRWVGHDPHPTGRAVLALNRAGDADEVLEALRDFRGLHQNVIYADTAGAFGYLMTGSVPVRPTGEPSPLPLRGWEEDHRWDGYVPMEEHPALREPDGGFVATANNRQTREPISRLISPGIWAPPYRAERIVEVLERGVDLTVDDMSSLQMDVESAFVARHRAAASAAFRRAGLETEAGELDGWDGRVTEEAVTPALFFRWLEMLRRSLAEDFYGPVADDGRPAHTHYFPVRMVDRALELAGTIDAGFGSERGAPWSASRVEELAARAASDAADGWEPRSWGEVHRLEPDHVLADVPVAGRLLGFRRPAVPRAGSLHTVNVAPAQLEPSEGAPVSFRSRHGASQRFVTDLADTRAVGHHILPGGQSGIPGHGHAASQLEGWRHGALHPIPLLEGDARAAARTRLRLVPGGGG